MPRHFALSTAKLGTMPRPSALSTDLLIWQLADSAFPTGGFAHSFGLEAAWHQGGVDGRSLPAFVRDTIGQTGRGGLPFVTAAHARPEQIETFDSRCDAFVRNPPTYKYEASSLIRLNPAFRQPRRGGNLATAGPWIASFPCAPYKIRVVPSGIGKSRSDPPQQMMGSLMAWHVVVNR